MEQHLPHKAVVHWQAAQIQVDNERGFADKMRIKYRMWHIVQPHRAALVTVTNINNCVNSVGE